VHRPNSHDGDTDCQPGCPEGHVHGTLCVR
jgi:hypothetical protein